MKIFSAGCFSFLIISLTVISSGCNNHDNNSGKVQIAETETVQQFDAGEKPYDKEAERLAVKYSQKAAIAQAQMKRGIDFARANGIDKLIEILKNPDDPRRSSFVSGDYYIWIIKTDYKSRAVIAVHPINKAITDRDFFGIKDASGKLFIHDIIRVMSYRGKGWTTYKWAHPRLKKAMDKLTYSERFDDYVLNDGFYLKD